MSRLGSDTRASWIGNSKPLFFPHRRCVAPAPPRDDRGPRAREALLGAKAQWILHLPHLIQSVLIHDLIKFIYDVFRTLLR